MHIVAMLAVIALVLNIVSNSLRIKLSINRLKEPKP